MGSMGLSGPRYPRRLGARIRRDIHRFDGAESVELPKRHESCGMG